MARTLVKSGKIVNIIGRRILIKPDEKTLTDVDSLRLEIQKSQESLPVLILIHGTDQIGKIFKIKDRIVLGRGSNSDIQINDVTISREHALFEMPERGNVMISDLNSKNGTEVNGEYISKRQLSNGDRVKIGHNIFKFAMVDELEKVFQDGLYISATEDPVTGVYNRQYFNEALTREVSYAKRHSRPISLIILDIDDFKTINDTHGHLVGDHVLRKLAQLIRSTIRTEDIISRIGGEEFAVIAKELTPHQTLTFSERLRKLVEKTIFKFKTEIPLTISLGCYIFDGKNAKDASEVVEKADANLLKAKRNGKNQSVLE